MSEKNEFSKSDKEEFEKEFGENYSSQSGWIKKHGLWVLFILILGIAASVYYWLGQEDDQKVISKSEKLDTTKKELKRPNNK